MGHSKMQLLSCGDSLHAGHTLSMSGSALLVFNRWRINLKNAIHRMKAYEYLSRLSAEGVQCLIQIQSLSVQVLPSCCAAAGITGSKGDRSFTVQFVYIRLRNVFRYTPQGGGLACVISDRPCYDLVHSSAWQGCKNFVLFVVFLRLQQPVIFCGDDFRNGNSFRDWGEWDYRTICFSATTTFRKV